MFLNLSQLTLTPETAPDTVAKLGTGTHLMMVHDGVLTVDGQKLTAGDADELTADATVEGHAALIIFSLTRDKLACANESHIIDVSYPVLFRLDEVVFPRGAIAYRHNHSGAGIRCLRRGELRLIAGDHSFSVTPEDSWFEAAHSPVRAEASEAFEETSFVRGMVLPPEYIGRSTFHLLNDEDKDKPRRQVTNRYIDRVLHGDAG